MREVVEPVKKRRFPLAESLVVAAIVAGLWAILDPVCSQTDVGTAGGMSALSRIKDTLRATMLYAEQAEGRYPPADRWGTLVTPFLQLEDDFQTDVRGTTVNLAMNRRLSSAKAETDEGTVLQFGAKGSGMNLTGGKYDVLEVGPGRTWLVGYCDGHAKWVVPKDRDSMKW